MSLRDSAARRSNARVASWVGDNFTAGCTGRGAGAGTGVTTRSGVPTNLRRRIACRGVTQKWPSQHCVHNFGAPQTSRLATPGNCVHSTAVIQIDFSDEHTAQDRARELAGLNGKTVTLTL